MTRLLAVLVLLWLNGFNLCAQSREAQSVLERFQAFRPDAESLAMYQLDWASSFEEAQERAAKERRPILLVIIHAKYGDLSSGHC